MGGRLRVGIDVSALALTGAGTARHVRGLLEALERDPSVEIRRYRMDGAGRAHKLARDVAWYPLALPRMAAQDSVDVLHCPTARAPALANVPLVLTIHDLAVLRFPRTFNAWTRRYSERALPLIARTAARIITVSEFSRAEIIELLGVPRSKISVIPNAVGPPFIPDGPRADGRYVLCVSTLEPRKNLTRSIAGFARASLGGAELWLVGAEGWGDVTVGHQASVRWLGQVDDTKLAHLYRGAMCVIYASSYEGFGLPVLEAMACGAPVVTSAGPPFDEFAGGVAVEVDPFDADSIAAGIVEATEHRDELRRSGPIRAAAYTWERFGTSTLAVYRELTR